MAVSITWATGVIFVPKADLVLLSGSVYSFDIDVFRLELKDLEDSDDGMIFLATHTHNTEVTLSGVVYARVVEIINGYTVEFEDGQYSVSCVGANHNIGDVKVVNQVSLIINNSAGLTAPLDAADIWGEAIEGAYTAKEVMRIMSAALAGKASGLDTLAPVFRDIADTKDRITAATDASGNRTAVTLDET